MFKLHTEAATRGVIYSLCNFIKKRLHHRPFTANVVKFLRSLNLRNIYEWLLLDISMKSFPNEFEKWLWKTKCYGSVMTEHVLAQRLLKSSKLPNQHEQLFQKYPLSFFQKCLKGYYLNKLMKICKLNSQSILQVFAKTTVLKMLHWKMENYLVLFLWICKKRLIP